MKRSLSRLPALIGIGLMACASQVHAGDPVNVIFASTTVDIMDAFDGECSLREAIHNASNNTQFSPVVNECPAGSASMTDVIRLVAGATYELTIAGAGNDEGDLDLFQNVPIALDLRFETDGGISTIQQNVAGQRVLHNLGLSVQMEDIIVRGGSVPDGVGGGILNDNGNITVNNVTMVSNSAISGAGIYNDGVLSLQNSQVILNTASLIGGGILNDTGASLSVVNTQIRANTATAGGGIYNTGGEVSVTAGSSINLNTASSGNGGGIENTSNGSLTITNASFEGNRALGGGVNGRGGAIRHDSLQPFVISSSSFTSNEAALGGALQVPNDTPLQVSGSTFTDNSASIDGGALHAVFLNVQNSSFEANQAGASGGAVLVQAVGGVLDSDFLLNEALAGGAIQAQNLELDNTEFRQNSAFGGGGAVGVSDSAGIQRSRFIDNSGGVGGGLFVHDTGGTGNLTSITRSLFTGNTATEGGGLYLRSTASIGNTTIHNNAATSGGGMYIHADGDVTAVNMSLAGHLAGQDLHKLGKLTMGNSIIYTPGQPDCTTTIDDPPIYTLGNNVVDDDSCFFDQDLPSDQEIANPMLDALADNGGDTMTLALLDGSPLIDAGSNDLCAAAPVNAVDQRGAIRPDGASCDIGAHEQGSLAPSIDEIFKDGFEQN